MDSFLYEAVNKMLEDLDMAAFFQDDVKEAFAQCDRGPAEEALLLDKTLHIRAWLSRMSSC